MATRFYAPSTGTAPVSPSVAAAWEHTGDLVRFPFFPWKTASAMANAAFTDEGAHSANNSDTVLCQYVSEPIVAQTLAAQTIKIQFRGSETNALNNISLTWLVKVVSNDGTSVTGTAVAIKREGRHHS